MNQTLIRSSCRSLCALAAFAALAACAPSEEGKIPCDDTSNCPSDFPTCSTAKFCVAFQPATKLVAVSGDAQSAAVAGVALPAALVVAAQDASGNGVPGVTITWAVTAGAGTITASSTTGADGTASVTPVLGNLVATNTFTATAAGLTPGTVTFTEASIAGPTTSFVVSFPANIGVQVAGTATVTAKDKNNNSSAYTGHVAVTLGKADTVATLPTGFALTITPTTPGTITGILFGKAATGQTIIVTDTTTASITGTSNTFNIASGTTTTVVTSNHLTAVFGQSVTFTAVVTPGTSGAVLPGGTVTFLSDAVAIGTGQLTGGQATFSTSSLSIGTHAITAVYAGDTGFAGSTSPAISQIINQASTTVTLASGLPTSTFGQAVTFTATVAVTAPGAGTPTGTVAFKDGGTTIGTCATQGLTGTTATCTTAALSAGSHAITAVYNGDTNLAASAASNTVTQTVNKAATTATVALTTGTTPSVFGQSVTFTATIAVTSPGAGTPTGTVAFKDGGTNIAGCATQAVSGTTATCSVSLAVGTHSITAVYNGDTNFTASPASPAISQVVNKASTTITVGSSSLTSVSGQQVTFTATLNVTAPGAGTPSGTIKFQDNGVDLAGCGAVSVTVATCSISNLGVGTTNLIVAIYSGDASFNGSTSPSISQAVNKADTTVDLTPHTPASKTFGSSVTFTATVSVTAPGAGTAANGDTVKFQNGGVDISGCTSQQITSSAATCTTTALPVGSNSITAIYNGDSNLNTSTSNTVTQTITKAPTTVAVTSNKAAPVTGETVTFTAAITPNPAGTATGSVTFKDGASAIVCSVAGQGTVSGNSASCSTTLTASASPHAITAVYGGDGNYLTSTSPAFNQTVAPAATTMPPVTFSPAGPGVGDTVTLNAIINVTGPGSGPATGNVTFFDGATAIGGSCTGANVTGSGTASCTTTTLPAGPQSITATFTNIDGNFLGTTTTAATVITIKDTPTITNFAFNQGATTGTGSFSATVTGNATAAPTGVVTISKGAVVVSTCTLPSPGSPPAGSCTTTIITLATGSQTFTATYPGDANYTAAAPVSVTPTVTALPPPGTAVVIDGGPASGKVLVVTGNSQATFIYDPATSKQTAGPVLSVSRSSPTATAIGGGQILIAGGNGKGGSTFELCTVAACSPAGALSTQRCNAAAALVGSSVLLAGGDNCSGVALASWDLWSAGGVVSSTAANQLTEARASLTATAVADGAVLLAGGGSKTAELFNAADLSVTKLPSMLAVRTGHTATLFPAGSKACGSGACVFLAGGVASGATWEIFDVAANSFGRPGNAVELLNPSRAQQAAALLADGRVLLAGGVANGVALETSETFDGARFTSGPALQTARTGVASAYLPALDLLLLAGGTESPELLTAP